MRAIGTAAVVVLAASGCAPDAAESVAMQESTGVAEASSDSSDDGGDASSTAPGTEDSASETGDDGPPVICKDPAPHDGAWFVEVTDEVGLGKTDTLEPLATGIVAGDLDGDGFDDLVAAVFPAQRQAPGAPPTRFVFLSRPDPADDTHRVFVDATDASGLLATRDGVGGRGFSVTSLGDLDNDGDLDAIACPGSGELEGVVDPCAAFLNDGSAHFELAPPSELEDEVFWVPSSAMLDWNEDGILDFWPGTVGEWAYGPALVSRPRLYEGVGDGTFVDVSAEAGLPATLTGGPGDQRMNFGVTSCDVDGDGTRDVLTGNYFEQPNYAWLFHDGGFVNVADPLGIARDSSGPGGHTFSVTCGDVDDDGDVDLMTAEVRHAWAAADSDHSELLRNDTAPGDLLGQFVRPGNETTGMHREHIGSAWTEGDNLALFADLDLDGKKDVLLASSNYPQQSAADPDYTHTWLWRQRDDGTFENATDRTPWAALDQQSLEGPALVDIDDDGDQDLVIGTGTFNSAYLGLTNTIHVYRNEVGQDANWTRVRLVGGGAGQANRSAIGAIVKVTAGGRTMTQEVLGSWGHSNTQSDTLVFGLGEACEIETIEVRWPDASDSTQTFHDVRANYAIELRQGESGVAYRE